MMKKTIKKRQICDILKTDNVVEIIILHKDRERPCKTDRCAHIVV